MNKITSILAAVSKRQNIEFGLVTILVMAILSYRLGYKALLLAVIILSLVTILVPVLFTPFTAVWYKLSYLLGIVASSILLSVIFFVIVTPVGCFRRLFRKDSLSLLQFKKSNKSTLKDRDRTFSKDDMIHTF